MSSAPTTVASTATVLDPTNRPSENQAVPSTAPATTAPLTTIARAPDADFTAGGPDGPTVLLIGDSSMAGLRWYDGVAEHLTGASYIVDVESCRRTVDESCIGRDGVTPSNVVEALRVAAVTDVDVLVVMVGYNEDGLRFDERVRYIGGLADELGIEHRLWVRFSAPDPQHSMVDTRPHNESLDRVIDDPASGWSSLDWPRHAGVASNVFEADRIHLTRDGAVMLAELLSQTTSVLMDGSCGGQQMVAVCGVLRLNPRTAQP